MPTSFFEEPLKFIAHDWIFGRFQYWVYLPILNYLLQNEGMTGVFLFNVRFSRLTFGLMEDTGLVYMSFPEVLLSLFHAMCLRCGRINYIAALGFMVYNNQPLSLSSALTFGQLLTINQWLPCNDYCKVYSSYTNSLDGTEPTMVWQSHWHGDRILAV